jgi:hypothetical protein
MFILTVGVADLNIKKMIEQEKIRLPFILIHHPHDILLTA